ncbi:hypothetical protein QBC34DRAFT_405700 [Podospora aff. communis PSN243]|uniref:Uncharacterized protein n=1 Tax=Podospora aff. communis PSN243 TaxID=3040156 RepID=A0AAV9GRS3_9PEZI|nr:hypothetical protein QBC34DRAFT_405700 [Podospora aff. communis PSN243]
MRARNACFWVDETWSCLSGVGQAVRRHLRGVDSAKGWQCWLSSSQTKAWGPRLRMLCLMRPMGMKVMATRRRLHVRKSCENVVRCLNRDDFSGPLPGARNNLEMALQIHTSDRCHCRFAEGPLFSNHARRGTGQRRDTGMPKSWGPPFLNADPSLNRPDHTLLTTDKWLCQPSQGFLLRILGNSVSPRKRSRNRSTILQNVVVSTTSRLRNVLHHVMSGPMESVWLMRRVSLFFACAESVPVAQRTNYRVLEPRRAEMNLVDGLDQRCWFSRHPPELSNPPSKGSPPYMPSSEGAPEI